MRHLSPLAMARMTPCAGPELVEPPAPVPTRYTSLDPAKTSPSLTLSNGGLTVAGSDHFGSAASLAPMPAQSWFEVTVDKLAGGVWMGVCTPSHFFGVDGAAWGGGDPYVAAIYLNNGGCWIAGIGYAMHDDDAGMASAAGAVWMLERDATKTMDSFGNRALSGVIRARRGSFVTRDYAAPLNTALFAAVGLDPGASQVTVNFGATPPVNPVSPGYVAP